MIHSRAVVETAHASRYLQQLSKHWSHRFAVEFDEHHARIPLPAGRETLDASADALRIELEGGDEAAVERLEGVVADHVKRFAFREDLVFVWRRHDA